MKTALPWHDTHEVRLEDLPEDLQAIIFQFAESSFDGKEVIIPDVVPLGVVSVRGLPAVPLDDDDSYRGIEYALKMNLDETPPILIANGILMDGRHRIFAARAQSRSTLPVIDLTGIIPQCAIDMDGMGKVYFVRMQSATK